MRVLRTVMISILVIALICAATPLAFARVQFTDVPADHPYSKAILTLLYDRIIDGQKQADGTYAFFPGNAVSRAEVVKMVAKALIGEEDAGLDTASRFSDVADDHWANKYINYTAETGIVGGYEDSTFRPGGWVTYAEAVKMLVCAKGYGHLYQTTVPWYDGYLKLADRFGITKGIDHAPTANASKGVVAQLIYNLKYENQLPRLYFSGDMSNMLTKEDEKKITVRYEDGTIAFTTYAKIKLQGTSSLAYEKKNYTVNFYSDSAYSQKNKVDLGWGKQNKYCLKANWIDKTHARNVVTARLVGQMQDKYGLFGGAPNNGAVDGYPVEIYINDSFHGLYTLNIPKDEWMFHMDSDNPDHIVVGGEDWGPETLFTAMPNLKMWEVEVGEENDYTLSKLNRLFDFVINSSDEEFKANIGNYLSLNATMNYYIMTDFAYLLDNLGKNMLLATYDGNKWYPCLYDLDTAWGTDATGSGLLSYEQYLIGFDYNNLFTRIEQCFPNELAERYFDLRKDVLTRNNVLFRFNAFADSIPETAYAKELVKWGPRLPGYDLSQIESFLDNMIPRLDAKYQNLKSR